MKEGLQAGDIKDGQSLCDHFEREVDKAWKDDNLTITYPFTYQKNAMGRNFTQPVCISVNNSVAHGSFTKEFTKGDLISADFGVRLGSILEGLVFDSAFTIEFELTTIQPWITAPLEALKSIAKFNGNITTTSEMSKIIQDTACSYSVNIVNSLTGHGIGNTLHEPPFIYNCTGGFVDVELFDNLCVCVEPIFVKKTEDERVEPSIAKIYMESDQWEIKTSNGMLSTHWETMFCYKNGRLIDLVGLTEW